MAGGEGLEPPNVGIKIRCLTSLANPLRRLIARLRPSWLRPHPGWRPAQAVGDACSHGLAAVLHRPRIAIPCGELTCKIWSGGRGSNSRPSPWQGDALPTELLPQEVGVLLGSPLHACSTAPADLPSRRSCATAGGMWPRCFARPRTGADANTLPGDRRMAPRAGVEPATFGLTVQRSTD